MITKNNPIDIFFDSFVKLKTYLLEQGQIDYYTSVENDFRKNLLISSVSFIESELQNILITFVESNSNHQAIINFLKKKAIKRQYHTYFNWDGKNINSFLGLFGEDFKDDFAIYIKEDEQEENIKSFIELGTQLSHINPNSF